MWRVSGRTLELLTHLATSWPRVHTHNRLTSTHMLISSRVHMPSSRARKKIQRRRTQSSSNVALCQCEKAAVQAFNIHVAHEPHPSAGGKILSTGRWVFGNQGRVRATALTFQDYAAQQEDHCRHLSLQPGPGLFLHFFDHLTQQACGTAAALLPHAVD